MVLNQGKLTNAALKLKDEYFPSRRDPLRQLGLAINASIRGTVSELKVESRIDELSSYNPGWWTSKGVDPGERVGDIDIVIATGANLVCIEIKSHWRGQEQVEQAARAARSLGRGCRGLRRRSILCCISGLEVNGSRLRATDGCEVDACDLDGLPSLIYSIVEDDPGFQPDVEEELAERMRIAEQRRVLVHNVISEVVSRQEDLGWFPVPDAHVFGDGAAVDLLIVTRASLLVCEALGGDEESSTDAVFQKARKLSELLGTEPRAVVPILVQPAGYPREALESGQGSKAWSLGWDDLIDALRDSAEVFREEPTIELEKLNNPFPGVRNEVGWDRAQNSWNIAYENRNQT